MPTVTFIGDDENRGYQDWVNPLTKESIRFPLDKPVNVDPGAPENKDRKALVKHIIAKLSTVNVSGFKIDGVEKVDGRTKEGRAKKASQE